MNVTKVNEKVSYIMRAKVKVDYVIIPNLLAQDTRMTLQAKGLLICMLSMPEDWRIRKLDIHKQCCSNGRDATVKAFNELVKLGYVRPVERITGNLRKIFDYYVYPQPQLPKRAKGAN